MEIHDGKFAEPVTEHGIWGIRTEQELRQKHLVANPNMKRIQELVNVIRSEQTEVSLLSG